MDENSFCLFKKTLLVSVLFALGFFSVIYFTQFFSKNTVKSKAATPTIIRFTTNPLSNSTNSEQLIIDGFYKEYLQKSEPQKYQTTEEDKCINDYFAGNISDHRENAYNYFLKKRKDPDLCLTYVDYNTYIKPRLNILDLSLANNMQDIKEPSKIAILDTFSTMRDSINSNYSDFKIRFFVFNFDNISLGTNYMTQNDTNLNKKFDRLIDKFTDDIVLPAGDPNNLQFNQRATDVISTTFHELIHLERAYKRYISGDSPIRYLDNEEHEAGFYSALANYYLSKDGYLDENEESYQSLGLRLEELSHKFDQLGYQPNVNPTDFRLYKFFNDYIRIFSYYKRIDYAKNLENLLFIKWKSTTTIISDEEVKQYLDEISKIKSIWSTFVKEGKHNILIQQLTAQDIVTKYFFQEHPYLLNISLKDKPESLACDFYSSPTSCIAGCSQKYTLNYTYMTDFRCFNTTCCFIPSLLPN